MSIETKQYKLLLQEEIRHKQEIEAIKQKIIQNQNYFNDFPDESFDHLGLDD